MLLNIRTFPRTISLGFLAVVIASGVARGQSASAVIDGAGMFSEDALRQARAELAKLDKLHGVTVTVETVESLRGQTVDEVAVRRAEQLGHKGIFVLIAKQEHKAEALASPRPLFESLGKTRLNEIRDAFTEEFRKRKIDDGLIKGIQAAASVLGVVRPSPAPREDGPGFLPSRIYEAKPSASTSPLVLRQQVRLTLAGARAVVAGAEAKAAEKGWKMNIAVVDDGGHLLAFARMDGARPASVATSTTKAISAATFRQATGPLPLGGANPDALHNLALENAAGASGGKITTLFGGVPIVVDGQVIGAIGVGGGSGEQDTETARAGVAAFLEGLQAKPEESKPKPNDGAAATPRPAEAEPVPK